MGWHITVFGAGKEGEPLVRRQIPASRLDWLKPLFGRGNAQLLEASGYPSCFRIRAGALLTLIGHPLQACKTWLAGADHVVDFSRWPGWTVIDLHQPAKCEPDEWLLPGAWDES